MREAVKWLFESLKPPKGRDEPAWELKRHTGTLTSTLIYWFHKDSNEKQRVGVSTTRAHKQRDVGSEIVGTFSPVGKESLSKCREARRSRLTSITAGEEEDRQWAEVENRWDREWRKWLARAQAREGFFFKKNRLWAHGTVYSACPVHTGQRTVAVWWTTG
jgi:hypothetical protein